jgi:hypothetical protein
VNILLAVTVQKDTLGRRTLLAVTNFGVLCRRLRRNIVSTFRIKIVTIRSNLEERFHRPLSQVLFVFSTLDMRDH